MIHIVLDAFLSETFGEVIERERSTFDRDFSEFVFFADHLGAFPTTRASMPAMLTGIAYRNEIPLDTAPTAVTDIPATILDLISIRNDQLPGRSALQIDPNASRRRTYARRSWDNAAWGRAYVDLLHVFSIDGRITDPSAWTFETTIFEPTDDLSAQLEEHQSGLFPVERGSDGLLQWGDAHVVTYLPPDTRMFTVSARKASEALISRKSKGLA